MRQTRSLLLLLAVLSVAGCSKSDAAPRAGTIVSLSPAATDLLVAMGLADRIVGVSPYEANAALREKLPKVGDYERIDWERMAAIKPQFLVVQGKRDRMEAGVRQNAATLGITTVILEIDRLEDIRTAVQQLGHETNNPAAASKLLADLEARQIALAKAKRTPAVPAMIALGENGTYVVGKQTYLDDALDLAGGANVLSTKGYFAIDAEKLASLQPRVVFLLLPAADAATVDRAKASLVRAGVSASADVVPLSNKDVLLPGTAAFKLAESMATHLRAVP